MQRLTQIVAWTLLLAIVILSLVPQPMRPVTSFPHVVEHASIYFFAGFAFGLAYPGRLPRWLLGLSVLSLGIEIAQLWIPGRHARGLDFALDVSALLMGLGLSVMFSRRSTIFTSASSRRSKSIEVQR